MCDYRVEKDVAVLSLNNPPLNALSSNVRRGLYEHLRKALVDAAVKAILIHGGSTKAFSAGADISEFNHKQVHPTLIEVIDALDKCSKPTVAVVQGYAFGGGLEIALACDYRISSSTAQFGLPEVKLGILPGAGGTQRLPRLVGLDVAMEWISTGRTYSAATARQLGIVEMTVDKDVVADGILFARACASRSCRKLSTLAVPDGCRAEEIFLKHMQRVRKTSRGKIAPIAALRTTRLAAVLPYAQGMKKEQESIQFLMTSRQGRAQIHTFLAERQARKWSVVGKFDHMTAIPAAVCSVGVVGLGTMGRGIVISLLSAGKRVHVIEGNQKALDIGVKEIQQMITGMAKKKRISAQQETQMMSGIVPNTSYQHFKDVDLVIEAVYESMEQKKKIFAALDRACKPSCILATNTSSLDLDEIASATSRPHQVMGMHFFAPAHRMRLLENVRGKESSAQTIATGMDMGRQMRKVTVLVGNCHGFVGNRMLASYTSESDFMLEEGAYPEEIDEVLRAFGFAMGRFQVGDLSGNDIGYRVRTELGITDQQRAPDDPVRFRYGMRYCPLADYLVEKGRLGLKSNGRGWFQYFGAERRLTVDHDVIEMIDRYRAQHGISARPIGKEEILERMLYPMINCGFRLLEEGIASCPSDIDMVWIHGYSWPTHTGGPMFYAHTVGLPRVLKVMRQNWTRAGASEPHWEPSDMLVDLVENHGNPDISRWMSLTSLPVSQKL